MTETGGRGTAWHAIGVDALLQRFDTDRRCGLSVATAAERLHEHGPNALPAPPRKPPWRRFVEQFHDVLIYVLLAAALLTAVLGQWIDAGVIVAVVLVNAVIGLIQEGKAERSLDAIRALLSPRATVLREGRAREVPATELVPGDLVLLQSGDKVGADLRLIEVRSLQVDESALTGESLAVAKSIDAVPPDTEIGDRHCIAHAGTVVTHGQAVGVVVATARATELGRIGALMASVEALRTPLLAKLETFGRWLTVAILLLATATFLIGTLGRGFAPEQMFMAAVGLAVAAIPEGLPAALTIVLAIGVQRMARRNAIVRRLPAVESLGSVTVICSDKTGTLTRNEMTVRRVLTASGDYEVEGTGYAPRGGFAVGGCRAAPDEVPLLADIGRVAALCNDSRLVAVEGRWEVEGDPMEAALLSLAAKAGVDAHEASEDWPRDDVIPFESEHRFMATLHHDHHGRRLVLLKGAPERVLELCDRERDDAGADRAIDRDRWSDRSRDVAADGHRLLALAQREAGDDESALGFDEVERGGFAMLALVGISDPPRDEAIEAIARCRQAGIRVKMVTGDHALTAHAIGRALGLGDDPEVLTGAELEGVDAAEWQRVADRAAIFARVSPEHKLRLVEALQARGEQVAMTGDGVNDAPALRRADVGIAMGAKGTEAAKEASEIVLADDNFATIAHAVEEGRATYENLKKVIVHMLPTNGGEAAMMLLPIVFGAQAVLPITPTQILWVNMVCVVALTLSLAMEPVESAVMRRPPRPPGERLLSRMLVWRLLLVSVLLVVASYGLYLYELSNDGDLARARTVAVNTLVAGEAFYLFNCRHLREPVLNLEGLTGNRWVLVSVGVLVLLQAAFTYAPPMQALFGTVGLTGVEWSRILGAGLAILLIVEADKAVVRRRRRTKAKAA